jgi:putative DNA methylase
VSAFHIRRLPHYSSAGQPIFLTWRLSGSLPVNRAFPAETTSGKSFVAMDRLLDTTRRGPLYLRLPEIAGLVEDAIRYREAAGQYRLHAYVVMPNHVHMLVTPETGISSIMRSLKRFTARQANVMLARTGQPFWQDESYDRLVRDRTEFERISAYIERNPVTAGLAVSPEEFRWSSARPIANRPHRAAEPQPKSGIVAL